MLSVCGRSTLLSHYKSRSTAGVPAESSIVQPGTEARFVRLPQRCDHRVMAAALDSPEKKASLPVLPGSDAASAVADR
jgi:hypothetical protein